ncbi:MAG: alpha/beta hydrolase [Flavobacteriaceae bacterium]
MMKIGIALLIIYVISAIILYFLQEKIIFQGIKLPNDYAYKFDKNFEEVNLKTADNFTLNALHFKVKNPKGVILYFHGNRGNLARWGEISSYFTQYNYDVFVMDYRKYGKSTGPFNETQMYNDAQICYEHIKKFYPEDKITIYGRSLGCTFAIKTAANNTPKQLILEAPFYSLTDVASYHYPLMPFKLLMKYKFESNLYLKNVTCKTTIFHGTNDGVVPFDSGKKLYESAIKKYTAFVEIPDGRHNDLIQFEIYKRGVIELLE